MVLGEGRGKGGGAQGVRGRTEHIHFPLCLLVQDARTREYVPDDTEDEHLDDGLSSRARCQHFPCLEGKESVPLRRSIKASSLCG